MGRLQAGLHLRHDLLRVRGEEGDREQGADPEPGADELRPRSAGSNAGCGQERGHRLQVRHYGGREQRAVPARHRRQDVQPGGERLRPEEHPGNDDCEEGEQEAGCPSGQGCAEDGQGRMAGRTGSPCMVGDQVCPMQRAPHHEGPVRAVPEPADQHGCEQVQVPARPAAAVAAQRDVNVVTQETRQGDVPTAPELDDAPRLVGRVEVFREPDAEAPRGADRHVRVAREIEVELGRVGQCASPGGEQVNCLPGCGSVEGGRDERRDAIGEERLLRKPDAEEAQSDGEVLDALAPALHILLKLRNDLVVAQYRACDQPGEEGNENGEAQRLQPVMGAAADINEEPDLLEGEERDPKGQDDAADD